MYLCGTQAPVEYLLVALRHDFRSCPRSRLPPDVVSIFKGGRCITSALLSLLLSRLAGRLLLRLYLDGSSSDEVGFLFLLLFDWYHMSHHDSIVPILLLGGGIGSKLVTEREREAP